MTAIDIDKHYSLLINELSKTYYLFNQYQLSRFFKTQENKMNAKNSIKNMNRLQLQKLKSKRQTFMLFHPPAEVDIPYQQIIAQINLKEQLVKLYQPQISHQQINPYHSQAQLKKIGKIFGNIFMDVFSTDFIFFIVFLAGLIGLRAMTHLDGFGVVILFALVVVCFGYKIYIEKLMELESQLAGLDKDNDQYYKYIKEIQRKYRNETFFLLLLACLASYIMQLPIVHQYLQQHLQIYSQPSVSQNQIKNYLILSLTILIYKISIHSFTLLSQITQLQLGFYMSKKQLMM